MRIAFFSPHSDPLAAPGDPDAGGQCVYEKMIAKALAAAGHEVRIYTRRWGNKVSVEKIHPNAIVHRYPTGSPGYIRKEDMGPFIREFTQNIMNRDREWLKSVDIVHGHYWDGGVSAMQVSNRFGIPLLFTSHSLGVMKQNQEPDMSTLRTTSRYSERIDAERRVIRSAQAVIALSQYERLILVDRYGANTNKIFVIPGGVDTQRFCPRKDRVEIKHQLGVSTDLLVFAAGRLDQRKGFVELVDSLPYVIDGVERYGRSVKFVLPASTKQASKHMYQYYQQIVERLSHYGIEDYIHWVSWLGDELASYYCAADVFVCPSLYEPFGLVVLEALATGTPVVATNNGGPREIIRNGIDGFVADPLDEKTFARCILKVVLSPEVNRARMAASGRQHCIAKYTWPTISEGIETIYEMLIQPAKYDLVSKKY